MPDDDKLKLDDETLEAFKRLAADDMEQQSKGWGKALSLKSSDYPEFHWPDKESLRLKQPDASYAEFDKIYGDAVAICAIDNFDKLCTAYGIDLPNPRNALLGILLAKYIPGFTPQKEAGAPTKWTLIHLLLLYAYVELRLAEPNPKDITVICNHGTKALPSPLSEVLPDINALRPKYYDARKSDEVVNYCVKQKEKYGTRWFQEFLDGKLTFDPLDTNVSANLPKLVTAKPIKIPRD